MEEKRKALGTPLYDTLKYVVRAACDNDLQTCISDQADTINDAFTRTDSATFFKTTRLVVGPPHKPNATIKQSNGTTCKSAEEEIQRWNEYARTLFQTDLQRNPPPETVNNILPLEPEVVKRSIMKMKNGRAAGQDGVQAEFINAMIDDDIVFPVIHRVVNKIWTSGQWPSSAL